MVAHALGNAVIRRYSEICTELLHQPKPFSTLQVMRAITVRAMACGLTTAPNMPGGRLSDLAAESIAGPWQSKFWNGLASERSGGHHDLLDATMLRVRGVCATTAYALAAALLYESIDEAFNALSSPLPPCGAFHAAIEEEASKPVKNESPRSTSDQDRRETRLRAAVEMILNGAPLHLAAHAHGWAAHPLERMLRNCVLSDEVYACLPS